MQLKADNQFTELSEPEVIDHAVRGSEEAFSELYTRYVRRIYNYVFYRTGNHNDAEDITERVFLRALKAIHRYDNRGVPFTAWLYRIAHNLIANWHRDGQRRKEVPLEDYTYMESQQDLPEQQVISRQREAKLLEIIRQLPPERQTLLILKFIDQLSNEEVGSIMGRSEGAVKSLYHRTLLSLRDYFDEP